MVNRQNEAAGPQKSRKQAQNIPVESPGIQELMAFRALAGQAINGARCFASR